MYPIHLLLEKPPDTLESGQTPEGVLRSSTAGTFAGYACLGYAARVSEILQVRYMWSAMIWSCTPEWELL